MVLAMEHIIYMRNQIGIDGEKMIKTAKEKTSKEKIIEHTVQKRIEDS